MKHCTLIFLALMTWSLAGCQGGKLVLRRYADSAVAVKSGFESGIYRSSHDGSIIIMLYDGPIDQPSKAMTIRVLWTPKTAKTPIDPNATNATIRYIVFGQGNETISPDTPNPSDTPNPGNPQAPTHTAIYSGAGYLYPNSKIGKHTLKVSIWQANLRLTDATAGYVDPIGKASLIGHFKVKHNPQAIEQALHDLSVNLTEKLGRPLYVLALPNITR